MFTTLLFTVGRDSRPTASCCDNAKNKSHHCSVY